MPSTRRILDREKHTKRQALLDYTEEYIKECAKVVRLGYYTIDVTDTVVEDTYMEILIAPNQLAVDITVGENFFDADPEVKRQTVAHELAHLHLNRITESIGSTFKCYVPPVSWKTLYDHVHRQEELTADELGHVIAPLLPKWNPPRGAE